MGLDTQGDQKPVDSDSQPTRRRASTLASVNVGINVKGLVWGHVQITNLKLVLRITHGTHGGTGSPTDVHTQFLPCDYAFRNQGSA